MIEVKKNDVFWGYFSQLVSLLSGVVVLPIILNKLTVEEIGLNYLLLTISSGLILIDFGFAPQIGRNITYIYSGVKKILKDGIQILPVEDDWQINYKLLKTAVEASKLLYTFLGGVVILLLLSFGTYYVSIVTNGFVTIPNSLLVWILFCVSVFFEVYYAYYSSLLNGKGLISAYRKAIVFSKLCNVFLTIILLYFDFGLISIVLANLISPFVLRFFCHRFFFNEDYRKLTADIDVVFTEKVELLKLLWFNASKLGAVYLGTFLVSKSGMFLAGLYLDLADVAKFGLMSQLVSILGVFSLTISTIYQPRLVGLLIKGDKDKLLDELSFTVCTFIVIFISGSTALLLAGDFFLDFFRSSAVLPTSEILLFYLLVMFLEYHHSIFVSFITLQNKIIFVKASLVSGIVVILLSFLILNFTKLGLVGLVFCQFISQAAYNNWRWPILVSDFFEINYFTFWKRGFKFIKNTLN